MSASDALCSRSHWSPTFLAAPSTTGIAWPSTLTEVYGGLWNDQEIELANAPNLLRLTWHADDSCPLPLLAGCQRLTFLKIRGEISGTLNEFRLRCLPPSLITLPQGCKFRPRCPHAFDKCMEEPGLENRVEEPGHLDRCWLSVAEKRQLRERTLAGEAAA